MDPAIASVFELVVGVYCLAIGVLLLQAAVFPTRNSLTKAIFWLCTIAPRAGSMTDATWVMINGVGMLLAGVLMLGLWLFGVT